MAPCQGEKGSILVTAVMFFNDVLDIHSNYSPEGSHSDILGDGYLLQSNSIYRNVKAFSMKIGCQYVEAYPEYLLLPFHELPRIVSSKKIPYVPSARLMKNVEQSQPGVFATDDVPMPESYHLHEAAHVIAEHFLKEVSVSGAQEKILKAILAESFANTVDALSCAQVADDVHHYFIKQNCYMHPQKKISQAVTGLTPSMGFRFVFMLIYFSYVHANFLANPLSKKAVGELAERYAPGIKLNAKIQKDIQTVCAIGEKLDPLFRVVTTGNYLKQQGFKGEVQDLLDFPFIKVFAGNPGFSKATEAISSVLA
jgi:hypothetical protein